MHNIDAWLQLGEAPSADNRRKFGRIEPEGLRCSLGNVKDFSGGGLGIQRRGPRVCQLGDEGTLLLKAGEQALTVPVRCVNVRRSGLLGWRYGLQFLEMDNAAREELMKIFSLSTQGCYIHNAKPHRDERAA